MPIGSTLTCAIWSRASVAVSVNYEHTARLPVSADYVYSTSSVATIKHKRTTVSRISISQITKWLAVNSSHIIMLVLIVIID